MKNFIWIFILALSAVACNQNPNQQTTDTETKAQSTDSYAQRYFIYDKEWRLVELANEKVLLDSTFRRYPHIVFQKNNRISGNLGCNNFGGEIEFLGKDSLRITGISATEIACPNLDIEQQFLEVLNNASAFHATGNKLTIGNQKDTIKARFEMVVE